MSAAQGQGTAGLPLGLTLCLPALLCCLAAGGATDDARLGALLALHHAVGQLGLALVPYSLLVVVPLMGRMSDAQPLARSLAARTFAAVVALMPLAQVREMGCLLMHLCLPVHEVIHACDLRAATSSCRHSARRRASRSHRVWMRGSMACWPARAPFCCSCWTILPWMTTRCLYSEGAAREGHG